MSNQQIMIDVPWYRFIDKDIESRTLASVGFTNLIAKQPYAMDDATLDGYRSRYTTLKKFQEITRDIFVASLRGEADPAIAHTVLAGQPPCRGKEFHLKLTEKQLKLPVFFRTDEAAPGAIVEMQCPGSGWEIADHLRDIYLAFPDDFGKPTRFSRSLASSFAQSLRGYVGDEPIIHHLLNNSSRPHGGRYFIQRCREEGLRFFSWDAVQWKDCNFIRAHEFYDLRYNGFFDQWMEACEEGRLLFDHPPTPLYDAKVIMAWPFWNKTREYYSDDIRALFPHTDIITPEGFHLADGSWVSLDDYCQTDKKKRTYYFKFAGTDPNLNWGSRAVYYTGSLSGVMCRQMFDRILADYQVGHHWIVQEARTWPETVTAIERDGQEVTVDAYTKLSGYYSPDGLVGILIMQEHSRKVHGSPKTVVSIVF
ncbi:hypothetical protein [Allocoleopsis franciscana]|uniref:Glutathionylspermidine synthase n=1 Tax=Allocoleopsis franciscana PCC 7113 TaxID=1173027 RepID=K9WG21_9CYAN|nr:hypothetical protein [Allocoleopsis franciscana]AFZ18741.1 hypothetical protein Mic7113_2968 [Allocoleopsis franciscana PCC 7113]